MEFLKKTSTPGAADGARDIRSVTVEPKPGHTDEEVVSRLRQCGAEQVSIIAPGFISARAASDALDAVCEIAHVHLKARKQLRYA